MNYMPSVSSPAQVQSIINPNQNPPTQLKKELSFLALSTTKSGLVTWLWVDLAVAFAVDGQDKRTIQQLTQKVRDSVWCNVMQWQMQCIVNL